MKRSFKKHSSMSLALRVMSFIALLAPMIVINDHPTVSQATQPPVSIPSAQSIAAGVRGSYPYLVWTERFISLQPKINDFAGSQDVLGLNLLSNTVITISAAVGNQSEPAIDGTLVAWQDNAQSCPTCEQDIHAEDLVTGNTYDVATGPADQSHPAVAGSTIAWIEFDGQNERLMTRDLYLTNVPQPPVQDGPLPCPTVDLQSNVPTTVPCSPPPAPVGTNPTAISSVLTSSGVTLYRPVMSNEYIVWGEGQPGVAESYSPMQIKAYNRQTGAITLVGQSSVPQSEYALADHRVVWNDPQLHIADLNTGVTSILYGGDVLSPAISGSTVVWSMRSTYTSQDYDIWGMRLSNTTVKGTPVPLIVPAGVATPLVVSAGDQLNPLVVPSSTGDSLSWQNDGGTQDGLILTTPLAAAFISPPPLPNPTVRPLPTFDASGTGSGTGTGSSGALAATPPLVKGMHAANGDGWDLPQAIDALGADQNAPYFGSVVVLDSDFGHPTNRSAPWGPTVADAMHNLQDSGVRVTVRLIAQSPYSSKRLMTGQVGSVNDVVQQLKDDRRNYPWIQDLQIDNEPNLEWPSPCSKCTYDNSREYTWDNDKDYRLYQAINDYYNDVILAIKNCDQTSCDPSANGNITFWSPPIGEKYMTLSTGYKYYYYLTQMIYDYDGLAYHVYSAPNYEGDGNGGIYNNSYRWFTSKMRNDVDNPDPTVRLRSQVTEWGWNPGVINGNGKDEIPTGSTPPNPIPMGPNGCNYTQETIWPARARNPDEKPDCYSIDQKTHAFEDDIKTFINTRIERHNAETINVWLVKRGNGGDSNIRANGLDSQGNRLRWFANYQSSSPNP